MKHMAGMYLVISDNADARTDQQDIWSSTLTHLIHKCWEILTEVAWDLLVLH